MITSSLLVSRRVSLSTGASAFNEWRIREGGGANVPGDSLVGVGFGGGGGGGVGVGIRVVKNFGETGDAARTAMSTPMSNVRGAER